MPEFVMNAKRAYVNKVLMNKFERQCCGFVDFVSTNRSNIEGGWVIKGGNYSKQSASTFYGVPC